MTSQKMNLDTSDGSAVETHSCYMLHVWTYVFLYSVKACFARHHFVLKNDLGLRTPLEMDGNSFPLDILDPPMEG